MARKVKSFDEVQTVTGVISDASFKMNEVGNLVFNLAVVTDIGLVAKSIVFSQTDKDGKTTYRMSAAKLIHKLLKITKVSDLNEVFGEPVQCEVQDEELIRIKSVDEEASMVFK